MSKPVGAVAIEATNYGKVVVVREDGSAWYLHFRLSNQKAEWHPLPPVPETEAAKKPN